MLTLIFLISNIKCDDFLEIEFAIMLFQSRHVDNNDMLVESSDQTSDFVHVNIETKLDLSHVSDVENELIIDKTQFDWSS